MRKEVIFDTTDELTEDDLKALFEDKEFVEMDAERKE